jgi:hypothetical protein
MLPTLRRAAVLRSTGSCPVGRVRALGSASSGTVAVPTEEDARENMDAVYSARVADFLDGCHRPYGYSAETDKAAAMRLSGAAIEAAKKVRGHSSSRKNATRQPLTKTQLGNPQAALLAPLGFAGKTAVRAISAADFVRKYGLHGVAGKLARWCSAFSSSRCWSLRPGAALPFRWPGVYSPPPYRPRAPSPPLSPPCRQACSTAR